MSKDKNQDQDKIIKKYKDSEGLTVEEMNFGLWLSENRRLITKIIVAFLMAVCAFFFIYSAYAYILYFMSSQQANNLLADTAGQIISRSVTTNLVVNNVQVLKSGPNYDLIVEITNPNDKFNANFNYCFLRSNTNLLCGQSFILPGATKYVLALNQDLSAGTSGLEFKITTTSWQRVDLHLIPDWNQYAAARLNFSVTNINFSAAGLNNLSGKLNLNSLEFTVTNQSPYSYYEVPVNIFLYNNATLIGVNRYTFDNFLAGESHQAKLTWNGSLDNVTRTVVVPDVNIADNSIFINYTGNTSGQ